MQCWPGLPCPFQCPCSLDGIFSSMQLIYICFKIIISWEWYIGVIIYIVHNIVCMKTVGLVVPERGRGWNLVSVSWKYKHFSLSPVHCAFAHQKLSLVVEGKPGQYTWWIFPFLLDKCSTIPVLMYTLLIQDSSQHPVLYVQAHIWKYRL